MSDISKICPALGISGVNLSVGYYNQHCSSEYLKIDEWEKTVERVENILKDPPTEKYEYIAGYRWSSYKNYYGGTGYIYNYSDNYTYETYDDSYDEDITEINVSVGDIDVNIDIMELVYSLGGTVIDWQEFLEVNKGEIENRIRERVLDEVYNLCTSEMPEFLIT